MNKPVELLIEELKSQIVDCINKSGLPHYIVSPILTNCAKTYERISANETNRKITEYKQATETENKTEKI